MAGQRGMIYTRSSGEENELVRGLGTAPHPTSRFRNTTHAASAPAVSMTQLPIVTFHPSFSTITPIVKVDTAVPRYAAELRNPDTVDTLPIFSNRRGSILTNSVFTAIMAAVVTANRNTVSTIEMIVFRIKQI